jgi:hypothetical protein
MNLKTTLVLLPALLLSVAPLIAQERSRVSPHETVNATIDGNEMKLVYGRPYSKDPKSGEKRKIWGTLVPFGKVWRLGADEATLLTTARAIDMNGTTIPAGTYSLFLLPEEDGAKLIVNKQTGQWGTRHDEKQDLARIDLKKEAASEPADQFTIAIEEKPGGGGVFQISWDETQYSVPFTVQK